MGSITALRLNRTRITDSGMDALASINIVKGVDLSGTLVTVDGVGYLRSLRPDIYVIQRDLGLWGDEEGAEPSDATEDRW
ncbi:hypothetical protein [Crateriforma spongiae]|uniref:hypothetical protein n=1 Tax=Crateriforma spongiae TaxID=2724528 RepID=UPI0039AEA4C5